MRRIFCILFLVGALVTDLSAQRIGQYSLAPAGGYINSVNSFKGTWSIGQVTNAAVETSRYVVFQESFYCDSRYVVTGGYSTIITDLKLFPNPVSDKAYVSIGLSDADNVGYKIYALDGMLVQADRLVEHVIDLSELKEGMYMIVFTVNNTSVSNVRIQKTR